MASGDEKPEKQKKPRTRRGQSWIGTAEAQCCGHAIDEAFRVVYAASVALIIGLAPA
jgi:hypothetical protein